MPCIACICEGTAEQEIITLFLDSNKLVFTSGEMLEEKPLRCRSAQKFEEKYLRKGFSEKITVYRILDSRREKFALSKAYENKVDVINVITAPEIEMLIILTEGKYSEYKKAHKKPSDFCKSDLRYTNVKSKEFIENYFSDIDCLIAAIKEYKRVSSVQTHELTLADLLKDDA